MHTLTHACTYTHTHTHTHTEPHKQQKQAPPFTTASKPTGHRPVDTVIMHSCLMESVHAALYKRQRDGLLVYVTRNNTHFLPPPLYTTTVSDMEYAQCMRHVLTAVDSSDLLALLEQTRLSSEELAVNADSEAAGQALPLHILYTVCDSKNMPT